MAHDPDKFDFFVSYARRDNGDGWITGFVDELLAQHRVFTGSRVLTPFFDKEDIRSLDDWQHRLHDALASSRLFLAFISPNYFASPWCRREWRTWIDREITRRVAQMCELPVPHDEFLEETSPLVRQLRRRQFNAVQPVYHAGINALRQADVRQVLKQLAEDLDQRVEHVQRAMQSETTVPPYNRQFSGRTDELLLLRERLADDRAGVISGIHGLGGVGKTELAFTFAPRA